MAEGGNRKYRHQGKIRLAKITAVTTQGNATDTDHVLVCDNGQTYTVPWEDGVVTSAVDDYVITMQDIDNLTPVVVPSYMTAVEFALGQWKRYSSR